MSKRMMVILLWSGIVGVLSGVTLAVLGYTPGIVPALITSISGGVVGVSIAAKLSGGIRDEMVVRVEHISGYYAFNATLWFIFVLVGMRQFSNFTLSVGDLLCVLLLFMSLSYVLFKYCLLKRGKAE